MGNYAQGNVITNTYSVEGDFFFFFKAKALQHMCEYKVLWGDSTYEFLMAILLYHI